MKEKLPYCTKNRALASALHMGGARILEVWREKGTQNVTFFLDPVDDLEKLLAAYDEMTGKNDVTLASISNEDAVRLAHLYQHLRLGLDTWIRDPRSEKEIREKGDAYIETGADGNKTIHHPGISVTDSNPSPKIRHYLNHDR